VSALGIACGVLLAVHPELSRDAAERYSRNVHTSPISAGGLILPEDIRLAHAAETVVRSGEKVLLPGVAVQMSPSELWFFAVGGARAIPLYSDVPFAFFHASDADSRSAGEYRNHVCERLDLAWLVRRGIVWVYEFDRVDEMACVHAWTHARDIYFERKLTDRKSSLWHLRTELLSRAEQDSTLGVR
jgi:hypothetical protein